MIRNSTSKLNLKNVKARRFSRGLSAVGVSKVCWARTCPGINQLAIVATVGARKIHEDYRYINR